MLGKNYVKHSPSIEKKVDKVKSKHIISQPVMYIKFMIKISNKNVNKILYEKSNKTIAPPK